MRNLAIALTVAFLFSGSAYAGDVVRTAEPSAKPKEIASVIKAQNPVGEGALKRLWIKGYDASLWSDASPWSMDSTYALTLKYARNFTREDLADASVEEIEHAQKLSDEQKKNYREQLWNLFPDVRPNDMITALYRPSKGATFFYNGREVGKITDDTFARQFLGIWLGPKTSEPELRQALLGQKNS